MDTGEAIWSQSLYSRDQGVEPQYWGPTHIPAKLDQEHIPAVNHVATPPILYHQTTNDMFYSSNIQ